MRAGSPFHLDPFKTSAWNALLAGRKRWVIYPPNQVPPSGVDVDEDEDTGEIDYTGEDPIVWFLEHYPLIKNRYLHPVSESARLSALCVVVNVVRCALCAQGCEPAPDRVHPRRGRDHLRAHQLV